VYHPQVVPPALLALAQARAAVAGDVHHVNLRRQYNLLYPRRGIMLRLTQSYHTRALPADSALWGRLRRKRRRSPGLPEVPTFQKATCPYGGRWLFAITH
jgi:hypothetical protein